MPNAIGSAMKRSFTTLIEGPVGKIEVLIDEPSNGPFGIAIIAHPQPLLGGSAAHKVPHVLARASRDDGWLAIRPNFRGVGASEGAHDHGNGEADDIIVLIDAFQTSFPGLPLALIGFSFGAFVQSRVAQLLQARGTSVDRIALLGLPVGEVAGQRNYATGAVGQNAIVVHGELDERVSLGAVFAWGRALDRPITVIPGADHFFTGRLLLLKSIVMSYISSAA